MDSIASFVDKLLSATPSTAIFIIAVLALLVAWQAIRIVGKRKGDE